MLPPKMLGGPLGTRPMERGGAAMTPQNGLVGTAWRELDLLLAGSKKKLMIRANRKVLGQCAAIGAAHRPIGSQRSTRGCGSRPCRRSRHRAQPWTVRRVIVPAGASALQTPHKARAGFSPSARPGFRSSADCPWWSTGARRRLIDSQNRVERRVEEAAVHGGRRCLQLGTFSCACASGRA